MVPVAHTTTGLRLSGLAVALMMGPCGLPGTGTSVIVTGAVVFPDGPMTTGVPDTGTGVAGVYGGTGRPVPQETVRTGG